MICKSLEFLSNTEEWRSESHLWASYPEVIQFFVPDSGADAPYDVVGRVLQPEQEDDNEDRERGETPAINYL